MAGFACQGDTAEADPFGIAAEDKRRIEKTGGCVGCGHAMIGAVLTKAGATPDKRPMRIGYIINSLERGGAAFRVAASAGSLRRCGAEVCFKQPVRVW